jgi:hypothetical protein
MPEPARTIDASTTTEQEKPARKPWQRQEGESALWYNRYCLFRDLGYKRTMQAALEKERSKISALKSTDARASSTENSQKLEKTRKKGQLAEVPKPAKAQVPGSWKQASITWRWVERARAWDAFAIEYMVEKNMEDLFENSHTLPMTRIHSLQSMLKALSNIYNAQNHVMTHEQNCMYVARMQSLLRDIKEEMRVYDETIQRAVTSRICTDAYKSLDQAAYQQEREAGKKSRR